MTKKALFSGLVYDEYDRQVETVYVGDEPCYVVDDDGFKRHIPSEEVDQQVLEHMTQAITGHESIISEQTAKMLGQEDIFTKAMIESQLKNIDQQMEKLFETGIPEDSRMYLGMVGFHIKIDIHGKVLEINQPGMPDPGDE